MGNKSRTLAEPADVQMNPQAVAAMDEAVNTMAALQDAYGHGRDLVNQLLGQAQMADAFEQFSRTVRTSKLAYVKENKLYQSLRGMKTPNGSVFSGTWEDFCGLLGVSSDKVDLDIANLRAFGEQALESMSRMGIGYRELRQYRRLDRDQQALLIEAAEAGDKGEFLDLAEELIARHAKEKAALSEALEKRDAKCERLEEVVEELNEENVRMKLDSKVVAMTDWPAALEPVSEQIAAAGRQLAMSISALETCRITIFASGQNLADHERLSFEAALHHVGGLYQEALERAERLLERERLTYDQTLGNFDGEAQS